MELIRKLTCSDFMKEDMELFQFHTNLARVIHKFSPPEPFLLFVYLGRLFTEFSLNDICTIMEDCSTRKDAYSRISIRRRLLHQHPHQGPLKMK